MVRQIFNSPPLNRNFPTPTKMPVFNPPPPPRNLPLPPFLLPPIPRIYPITYPRKNFPLPEPKPIPITFTPPPFDPNGYDLCGNIYLRIGFGWKLLKFANDLKTNTTISIRIPVGVEAFAAQYRKCFPSAANASTKDILDIASESGSTSWYEIDKVTIKETSINTIEVNHDCYNINPPFGQRHYPVYCVSQLDVTIFGNKPGVISELLGKLTTSELKPEVIKLQSSNKSDNCSYPPPLPPILPPPPPRPPMTCCPNVEQNDQLLRLILKRIGEPKTVTIFDENLDRKGAQKANKTPESLNDYLKLAVERVEIANRIVGIENFPITVPDTMIEPYKEGAFSKIFGFIDGDKKRKIQTIAEFIAWMSEQDSAVLGEFHQVIEYESDEKGKDGKPKKKTLVLPNVAETLKEITLLVAQMAKQNNVQTEVLFKTLFEIVATRAEATKGTSIVQDIQDYLDYPTESKSVQYGSSVSLPDYQVNKEGKPIATGATEDHKNLLKPGKVRYVYEDWTGDNSFHDQMIDLLQVASMLRAILYQRTDK